MKPLMPAQIEAAIVTLLGRRNPQTSICPSEAARLMGGSEEAAWRALMPMVRDVAQALAERGVLQITRRGQPVHQAQLHHGAIRLRRGPAFDTWRADQNGNLA